MSVGSDPRFWRVRGRELPLNAPPLLMGIVNVTPDSFSDGGALPDVDAAVAHGRRLAAEGAAILDVGGESTRPGAEPVPAALELERTIPVVERLARETGATISIDTTKLEVAAAAIAAGAGIVNDVSALRFAPGIARLAAETGAGLVLMHMRGDPRTMQADTRYEDLLGEIGGALARAASQAEAEGVPREAIAVDPGIGFGKSAADNWRLIDSVGRLTGSGYPVLIGHSRKSFLDPARRREPGDRLPETLAAGLVAAMNGAAVLRVHDVGPHARMLAAWGSYREAAAERATRDEGATEVTSETR